MPLINNTIIARRRLRPGKASSTPPVLGPVLVQAFVGDGDGFIRLVFDEPIDAGGINGSQIIVDQASTDGRYSATKGVSIVNANTIQVGLDKLGPATQGGAVLYASSANGIVSAIDSEPWSGVSDLELPFP